jgi:molybdopterin molybdotransferase
MNTLYGRGMSECHNDLPPVQTAMKNFVGFSEALDLTLCSVPIAGTETLPLNLLTGRTLSKEIVSRVDSPSVDTSLRDGYAVISSDLIGATREDVKKLKVTGSTAAGSPLKMGISRGEAIKVTTGAPIPEAADAVLSEEFCHRADGEIHCFNTADQGQNILKKGIDIRRGERVSFKGEILSPALIGLIASAGQERAPVYKSPRVAVMATGDEVVAPGRPLQEGKLYASNMVEICSWLALFGLPFRTELVSDRKEEIASAIVKHLPHVDAFITTGGAWGSERDLIIGILEDLGWQGIYHRVRMGPGKAVGFGLLQRKPFFCLPGGPPSNEMAFLQLALPGLLAMEKNRQPLFPSVSALLTETVRGDGAWTQFIHALIVKRRDSLMVKPVKQESRLQSMAKKEALIILPEGREVLLDGEQIEIQLLIPRTPRIGSAAPP